MSWQTYFFLGIKMYPGRFCEKNSISKDQVRRNFDSLVPLGCLENGVGFEHF